MSEPQSADPLGPVLERLERAYQEAVAIVEAAPSAREGTIRAAVLFQVLFRLRREAAKLRERKGRQVWTEEELSLAQVAGLMRVTKGRAGQLFPAASRGKGES